MTAITLTVVNFNGQPPAGLLSACFDELGGSIGRADSNQLVLDDPDRTVSRVHAQIVFRGGQYALIDRGSNPVLINGREVGSGREARIQAGDTLQIGGYQLTVAAAASAAPSADPFADLLGPAATPAAAAGGWVDPLAAFGQEAAPPARRSSVPGPAAATPAAVGGIPDDWDPFAEPAPAGPSPLAGPAPGAFGLDGGAAAPAPLIPDLGASGSAASLDSLFGLGPSLGGDPLAQGKLDAPLMQPNTGASADALQALSALPQATATAAPDTVSALNQPFLAPPTAASAAPRPPRAGGAVLSWSEEGGDGHTLIRPATPRPAPAAAAVPAPPAPQRAAPAARPEALPAAWTEPPAATQPQPASPSGAPPSPAEASDLLQAFREGLATPGVAIEALSPALMRLLGELLREAAAGTVDLLVARAALKREVKAEATMIVARENNPLKFSPSAEAALQHLLAPPVRGFMAAGPAMRDAYDDLRAHQFGVIAGMRAALEGVLERFDPAQLEGRLVQRSRLASLLPGSRKAQLWELFVEHYAQISQDAAEDFHSLFGKAFLKAYEEHIDRLQRPAP
ncbi:type VI secretion system-associated FHA domain protein TagH [Aquariibacter albus]|uniref:type VI secretion system-associated FHA domain protein TagH n=1 Tax=Aquariibacter albus TaxID=2759899 RepID=UPI001F24AE1D|nr:type VI secretion system-associated FHA domain protein TagH [Aquariibacter albus]